MKYFSFGCLMIVLINVTGSHGVCSTNRRNELNGLLNAIQPNGLHQRDQAGTYDDRRKAMAPYNKKATKYGCTDLLTEQDHMPPKSAIDKANKEPNPSALAKALGGSNGKKLAMTYLKKWHQGTTTTGSGAGTTGNSAGAQAVHKLIKNAIDKNAVQLTYKLSVMATNAHIITAHMRNFDGYLDEYLARLKAKGVNVQPNTRNTLQNWNQNALANENSITMDPTFRDVIEAFDAAAINSSFGK